MPNVFIRTSIAPYRVDTYNALHHMMGCEMYFMSQADTSQDFDMSKILNRCEFTPHYLRRKKFWKITYFPDIWKIIRSSKAKVVIVPEFKLITIQAILYKFLFNRKLKVVSMCDDSYAMVSRGEDFTKTHALARNIVVPFLDNLLLVDSRTTSWYQDKYSKGIWLPIIRDEQIECPKYEKAIPRSNEFCRQYKLDGKKVLLFVGRLVNVKNLPFLLDAISYTKEEFTTVLIGDGELASDLKKQAESINKEIIFAGRYEDEDIRAWYNIADVFILPSYLEPFGAVTNEALLSGAYALVSEACGSACLIDGKNGKIISSTDKSALAHDIDAIMSAISPLNSGIKARHSKMALNFKETIEKALKNIMQ